VLAFVVVNYVVGFLVKYTSIFVKAYYPIVNDKSLMLVCAIVVVMEVYFIGVNTPAVTFMIGQLLFFLVVILFISSV